MSRNVTMVLTRLLSVYLCINGPALAQSDYRYAVFLMPSLGGEDSVVLGVNSIGVCVGQAFDGAERFRPTMWPLSGDPLDLGTLGGNYGDANAINSDGVIVGWANLPGGSRFNERAFIWRDGQMSDLGTLGGDESEATDINESGQIVGWSNLVEGGSSTRAFLWRDGQMEALSILETRGAMAFGLNDAGQVVGQAISDTFGAWRTVLWENGNIRDLGALRMGGRGSSAAFDINDAGYIVGGADATERPSFHAFVWFDGRMYDLGTPAGKREAIAWAINNHGQIVGFGSNGAPTETAFLWELGRGMQKLDDLIAPRASWRLFDAKDINDAGQIVGYGTRRGAYLLDGFLLTPVRPTMDLAAPSPGRAGQANTLTVTNCTPGAIVQFLYSRHGGGMRIPGCDLQQNAIQLDSPTVIGTAIADQSGIATITRNVPPVARNQIILFQAVVQNECAISQLVVFRFE